MTMRRTVLASLLSGAALLCGSVFKRYAAGTTTALSPVPGTTMYRFSG